MNDIPIIALVPMRSAVARDRAIELDLVVTITPPQLETTETRPALNLGLVLDRSGSMSGTKLRYAKQAACYAVEQLLPTDRVGVTIFDDEVETLVPSTLASDKRAILSRIQQIEPSGTTALHAGWLQGAMAVSEHLDSDRLNRVLLLSDGLANVGERNPQTIGEHVSGLATRKVSTSTLGLGNDYDEDLLAT
ncbi:MAG: VWA domain-containing protein, partial [Cyanobacteria bacterium J06639_1]